METRYKWPPFVSQETKESMKQELNRILKEDLIRCACKQLTIRFHTFNLDTHFRAELNCQCGSASKLGFIEGLIPEAEDIKSVFEERRLGKNIRSAIDRRKHINPNVTSTRDGKARRTGKSRRKSEDKPQDPKPE